jgi:hypothetical protein
MMEKNWRRRKSQDTIPLGQSYGCLGGLRWERSAVQGRVQPFQLAHQRGTGRLCLEILNQTKPNKCNSSSIFSTGAPAGNRSSLLRGSFTKPNQINGTVVQSFQLAHQRGTGRLCLEVLLPNQTKQMEQ